MNLRPGLFTFVSTWKVLKYSFYYRMFSDGDTVSLVRALSHKWGLVWLVKPRHGRRQHEPVTGFPVGESSGTDVGLTGMSWRCWSTVQHLKTRGPGPDSILTRGEYLCSGICTGLAFFIYFFLWTINFHIFHDLIGLCLIRTQSDLFGSFKQVVARPFSACRLLEEQ